MPLRCCSLSGVPSSHLILNISVGQQHPPGRLDVASCSPLSRYRPWLGPGLPGAPCRQDQMCLLYVPDPQIPRVQPQCWMAAPAPQSVCWGIFPHVSDWKLWSSHDFPPSQQGNCYVWNLTGGIGDEVTQLIPKTKIPAHTRYALQCRFSPDSTCGGGLGDQEASDGFGKEGTCWLGARWVGACLVDSKGVHGWSGC